MTGFVDMRAKQKSFLAWFLFLFSASLWACGFEPSITPVDWATPPPGSSFGVVTREEQVQEAIDAGDYQRAIELAIDLYEIDISDANGPPTYSSALSDTSVTHDDGTVEIGSDFFATPGLLATTLGHEMVHTHQLAEGRWYLEEQGVIMNEVEAYDWELQHADANGLSGSEIEEITLLRSLYYDALTEENQALADQGNYLLPLPAAATPGPRSP
jgi:hypothetical protein